MPPVSKISRLLGIGRGMSSRLRSKTSGLLGDIIGGIQFGKRKSVPGLLGQFYRNPGVFSSSAVGGAVAGAVERSRVGAAVRTIKAAPVRTRSAARNVRQRVANRPRYRSQFGFRSSSLAGWAISTAGRPGVRWAGVIGFGGLGAGIGASRAIFDSYRDNTAPMVNNYPIRRSGPGYNMWGVKGRGQGMPANHLGATGDLVFAMNKNR